MENEPPVMASMKQRVAARQLERQKKAELQVKIRAMEAAAHQYTRHFNRLKNFSNTQWRQLVRDPKRLNDLEKLLRKDWGDIANRQWYLMQVLLYLRL